MTETEIFARAAVLGAEAAFLARRLEAIGNEVAQITRRSTEIGIELADLREAAQPITPSTYNFPMRH
jgi:hypothetical protein